MSFPKNLKYTKDHEWISAEGQTAQVGVTSYAVEQLGDVVHLDLPNVGQSFGPGESFGTIESTKTVSDLYMPVAGKVTAVNEKLKSAPETLQKDCYQDGWLVKLEISNPKEVQGLMTPEAYETFVKEN